MLGGLTSLTGGGGLSGSSGVGGNDQQTTETTSTTGSKSIVIAPSALNLGEILQNMSGPTQNGGYGVDPPARGFDTKSFNTSSLSFGSTQVDNKTLTIALAVGGVVVLALLLRRR